MRKTILRPLVSLSDGTTYIPDIYLPHEEKFVEIKGYWFEDARIKFAKFQEEYPELKITVLDKVDYKTLESNYKFLIPHWE